MHTAFELVPLIPAALLGSDAAITSILLHDDQVIVGTSDGALLVFGVSNASTSQAPSSAHFVTRVDALVKQSIDQLGYLKELNAVICLSGGDISLYDLPTLSLIMSLSVQTRSAASLFLVSSFITPVVRPPSRRAASSIIAEQQPLSDSVTSNRTILAVACKRKLVLFHWIDGTWITPSELPLPHQIRGMDFIDITPAQPMPKILAGFSTGAYGIVSIGSNSTASVLSELFVAPTPPSIAIPLSISSTTLGAATAGSTSAVGGGGGALERFGGLAKVGGLAKATSTAMGLGSLGISNLSLSSKKVDRNGVIALPRLRGRQNVETKNEWMFAKEWGWEQVDDDDREMLVLRDNFALPIVFSAGSPSTLPTHRPAPSRASIVYPIAPSDTAVLPPYIISVLPSPSSSSTPPHQPRTSTFQIHSAETLELVQVMALPPSAPSHEETASLSSSPLLASSSLPTAALAPMAASPSSSTAIKLFKVAAQPSSSISSPLLFVLSSPTSSIGTEQSIWKAESKSWPEQVEELGRSGLWEEAVRLVRKSPDRGRCLSDSMLRRLSQLHSLSLFRRHLYDYAIDAFILLDIAPSKVISLYPIKISGKLCLSAQGVEELFGGRSNVAAAEVDRTPLVVTSTDESAPEDDSGEPSQDATSLLNNPPPVFESEADQHEYSRSVDVLIRYLTDRRQKYALALSALPSIARPLPTTTRTPFTAADLRSLPDVAFDQLSVDELIKVAVVVDTALFRCYLSENKRILGSLCRIDNWCEVEEVEEALLGARKYAELLDLYKGKGMHDRALVLLKRVSADEEDLQEQVGPTIRYLQKLGSAHVDLIFASSKWILESDESAGVQIFIADLEEVESLPRHATMQHLDTISPPACETYLEHIVTDLGEEGPDFHEKLIELYLRRISVSNVDPLTPSYRKLVAFLESSTAYRADRILGRLPSDELYEVQAILLGRLGRHEGALSIYVNQLKDHVTAEAYCARVYESMPAMRTTIFHLLLRLYLLPPSAGSSDFSLAPALALLATRATFLSPTAVLDLLPPFLPLQRIQTFLEKNLRKGGQRSREGRIMRELTKAEKIAVDLELVEEEGRRVKITEMRTCPQCHKRLGNSVIAIHAPRGEVTHYQCREEFQQNKLA